MAARSSRHESAPQRTRGADLSSEALSDLCAIFDYAGAVHRTHLRYNPYWGLPSPVRDSDRVQALAGVGRPH